MFECLTPQLASTLASRCQPVPEQVYSTDNKKFILSSLFRLPKRDNHSEGVTKLEVLDLTAGRRQVLCVYLNEVDQVLLLMIKHEECELSFG